MIDQLWIIVVFMALATYIPRLLPMVFLCDIQLPAFLHSCLEFIPYAILGALIFPGVLNSTGNLQTAVAGMIAAAILGILRLNLMLVVITAIGAAYLCGLII